MAIFQILAVIFSFALVVLLLLQVQGGAGLNVLGDANPSFRARRGFERLIFRATIVCSALFLLATIANLIYG